MIRGLPGSVRDVTTLLRSLQEIDAPGATLVLDRGFVSEANENLLLESGLQFVLPMRRNSRRYETQIHLTDHSFYHKRLSMQGKVRWTGSDALSTRMWTWRRRRRRRYIGCWKRERSIGRS